MVRSTIAPSPELLEELELLEEEELLEDELELLLELLEEELELLDDDVVPELDPLPPHAVSAAVSNRVGTTFILWYFPYTFIMAPFG